jgi:hypothetical protein
MNSRGTKTRGPGLCLRLVGEICGYKFRIQAYSELTAAELEGAPSINATRFRAVV